MSAIAGNPLLRISPTELQFPMTDYGVHLCLDVTELPEANPLAAHRADFCLELNGVKREMSWEKLFKLMGLDQ